MNLAQGFIVGDGKLLQVGDHVFDDEMITGIVIHKPEQGFGYSPQVVTIDGKGKLRKHWFGSTGGFLPVDKTEANSMLCQNCPHCAMQNAKDTQEMKEYMENTAS